MGIFDRPKQKIRKKIPANAQFSFDTFLAVVISLPEWVVDVSYLDENRKELLLGVIMSVWACNSSIAGEFHLNEKNYRYVQNMGANCFKLLKNNSYLAENLLDLLMKEKIIPHIDQK